MDELFKQVFDELPHVEVIWVDADGNYYLHPRKGCEKVYKPKQTDNTENAPVVTKSKKKK